MQAVQRDSVREAAKSIASSLAGQDGISAALNHIHTWLAKAPEMSTMLGGQADSPQGPMRGMWGGPSMDAAEQLGSRDLIRWAVGKPVQLFLPETALQR